MISFHKHSQVYDVLKVFVVLQLGLEVDIELGFNFFEDPGQFDLVGCKQNLHFTHIFQHALHLFLLQRISSLAGALEWITNASIVGSSHQS